MTEKHAQLLVHSYTNYTGIRISRTGRRFYIKQATVWNLIDEGEKYCGQAATFSEFEYIDIGEEVMT